MDLIVTLHPPKSEQTVQIIQILNSLFHGQQMYLIQPHGSTLVEIYGFVPGEHNNIQCNYISLAKRDPQITIPMQFIIPDTIRTQVEITVNSVSSSFHMYSFKFVRIHPVSKYLEWFVAHRSGLRKLAKETTNAR